VSFLVHLERAGREVALISTADLGELERLDDVLSAAGYKLTVKHNPPAVVIQRRKPDAAN